MEGKAWGCYNPALESTEDSPGSVRNRQRAGPHAGRQAVVRPLDRRSKLWEGQVPRPLKAPCCTPQVQNWWGEVPNKGVICKVTAQHQKAGYGVVTGWALLAYQWCGFTKGVGRVKGMVRQPATGNSRRHLPPWSLKGQEEGTTLP